MFYRTVPSGKIWVSETSPRASMRSCIAGFLQGPIQSVMTERSRPLCGGGADFLLPDRAWLGNRGAIKRGAGQRT